MLLKKQRLSDGECIWLCMKNVNSRFRNQWKSQLSLRCSAQLNSFQYTVLKMMKVLFYIIQVWLFIALLHSYLLQSILYDMYITVHWHNLLSYTYWFIKPEASGESAVEVGSEGKPGECFNWNIYSSHKTSCFSWR